MAAPPAPSLATLALHADDVLDSAAPVGDVAPAIHVSTIFHYPQDPSKLITAAERLSATQNGEVGPSSPSHPHSPSHPAF